MAQPSPRIRLDQLLSDRALAASRSRARDMVARGCVLVNGTKAKKAGTLVAPDAEIAVDDPAHAYVSRAALKLIAGLDVAEFDVTGQHALDLGASTGGFTQVLLERGAASVLAVDVGHGQMAGKITDDPRVTNREGLNARALTNEHLEQAPSVIVSDLSFVSLTIAAEPALLLATKNAVAVLLVKPQFEVGKDGVGKGGLVNDQALVDEMLERVTLWFNSLRGWAMTRLVPSPIHGGDGNLEYLLCGVRNA